VPGDAGVDMWNPVKELKELSAAFGVSSLHLVESGEGIERSELA